MDEFNEHYLLQPPKLMQLIDWFWNLPSGKKVSEAMRRNGFGNNKKNL
jgi:hypothetical protein